MNVSTRTPVIAIGLDAAEVTLVEELCRAGKMPTLQRLRERGRCGLIRSEAEYFLSTVWPTFSTATNTEYHGWYFNKMWRPDRMRLEYASEEWLGQNPFWEWPGMEGLRMAILDLPYTDRPPETFNGAFVCGWQTHDDFGRFWFPAARWRELERTFGRPVLRRERFGKQTPATLLRLRRELLDSQAQIGRICRSMLQSEAWDLFLVVIGSLHRGTHYLWDLEQIDHSRLGSEDRRILERSRDDLFVEADRTVSAILEAAPSDARILVFALHGMTRNDGWAERFPALVHQIRRDTSPTPPAEGFLYRWKRRIPWRVIRQFTTRLPTSVNQALVPIWSARMLDWSRTRFFALPLDINGYLRVNLRGREAAGIVEPGQEYEELLEELEEAFLSFRAIDTGEQVVRDVTRTDDILDPDGPRRQFLPDLIVRFRPIRTQELSGVVSARYGEIRWTKGSPLPSGRSGNHLPTGWLVAAGPGIEPGPDLEADSVDIIPTILSWLDADVPSSANGPGTARPRTGSDRRSESDNPGFGVRLERRCGRYECSSEPGGSI